MQASPGRASSRTNTRTDTSTNVAGGEQAVDNKPQHGAGTLVSPIGERLANQVNRYSTISTWFHFIRPLCASGIPLTRVLTTLRTLV